MSLASLARSVRSVTLLRRFARYVTLRDYVIRRRAHTPPGKNSVKRALTSHAYAASLTRSPLLFLSLSRSLSLFLSPLNALRVGASCVKMCVSQAESKLPTLTPTSAVTPSSPASSFLPRLIFLSLSLSVSPSPSLSSDKSLVVHEAHSTEQQQQQQA